MSQNQDRDQDQDQIQGVSLEGYNFEVHEPKRVSRCWKPSEPCVSLTKQVLYINTKAIRQFELSEYTRVALFYDEQHQAMLLDLALKAEDQLEG